MTTMKVTREKVTDEQRLAKFDKQIAESEAWTETLKGRRAAFLAEIKAKAEKFAAFVAQAKEQ